MARKLHTHEVTINEKRRANKRVNDIMSKDTSKTAVQGIFNTYYRNQLKALYRAVRKDD